MTSISQEEYQLSSLEAQILSLAVNGSAADPLPLFCIPWTVKSNENSFIKHLQNPSDDALDKSISNLTKYDLISTVSATATEIKNRPTLFLHLVDYNKATTALKDYKAAEDSNVAQKHALAEIVEIVSLMIPPMFNERRYWWWSKAMLPHIIKIVDAVLGLQSQDQLVYETIFPSDEFGSLIMYLMWNFQCSSNYLCDKVPPTAANPPPNPVLHKSTLYGKYLSSCYPWISLKEKEDKMGLIIQLRMSEMELSRFCLQESPVPDIESSISKMKNMLKSHGADFSVEATVSALLKIASSLAFLSKYEAATEAIQFALNVLKVPKFINDPNVEVPADATNALLLADVCIEAATLRLNMSQFDTCEPLCDRALKIICALLGREHISTFSAILISVKAANELRLIAPSWNEKILGHILKLKNLFPETCYAALFRMELARMTKNQLKGDTSAAYAEQAYAELTQVMDPKEPLCLSLLMRLATAQSTSGRTDAAFRNRKQLVALTEEKCGAGSSRHVSAVMDLASSLDDTGDQHGAIEMVEGVLQTAEENSSKFTITRIKCIHTDASEIFFCAQEIERGREQAEKVLELCKGSPDPLREISVHFSCGMHYEFEENVAEATECYDRIVEMSNKLIEENRAMASRVAPLLINTYIRSAHTAMISERIDLALPLMESTYAAIQDYIPNDPQMLSVWYEEMSAFHIALNDFDKATSDCQTALKLLVDAGAEQNGRMTRLKNSIREYGQMAQKRSGQTSQSSKRSTKRRSKISSTKPTQGSAKSSQDNLTGTDIAVASGVVAAVAVLSIAAMWFFRSRSKE